MNQGKAHDMKVPRSSDKRDNVLTSNPDPKIHMFSIPLVWHYVFNMGASTTRVLLDSHSACLDLRLGVPSNLSNISNPLDSYVLAPDLDDHLLKVL